MTDMFILRGRCIDGTVYLQDAVTAPNGEVMLSLSTSKHQAKRLLQADVDDVTTKQRARNARSDADSIVGQLVVLPAPPLPPPLPTRTHRQRAYAATHDYWLTLGYAGRCRPRRIKHHERKALGQDEVMMAHYAGEAEAMRRRPRNVNPYPPGRRHDAWQHAFNTADPLGDWHGGNY